MGSNLRRIGAALLVLAALAVLFGDFGGGDDGPQLLVVNTSDDELDTDANDRCSLREAIVAANTAAATGGCPAGEEEGTTTIAFAPGVSPVLSIENTGGGEDAGATGDLDVTGDITLAGPADSTVTIDAGAIDRVFDVRPDGSLRLENVTVTGGETGDEGGGAIRNEGILELVEAAVLDSTTEGSGGGILNSGTLDADRSTIAGNTAVRGGGLANIKLAQARLAGVTVSGNEATVEGGGGIDVVSGTVTLDASTVTANVGPEGGAGGIASDTAMGVALERSIVADNEGPQCLSLPVTAIVSSGFNLMSDGTCNPVPFDTPDQTASLGPLTADEGPTPVHVPRAGSAAIDAIPEARCGPATEDQRGSARPQLSDRPCDIGAVEVGAPAEVTSSSVTTSTLEVIITTTTLPDVVPAGPSTTQFETTTSVPTTVPSTTTTTVAPSPPAEPTSPTPLAPPAPPLEREPRVAG